MESPNPESLARIAQITRHKSDATSKAALDTYTAFLSTFDHVTKPKRIAQDTTHKLESKMAATLDRDNPASPLHYTSAQTALLLLDFQGFCIARCESAGTAAVAKAALLREWAMKLGIIVLHSIVNVNGAPPPTCKGAERILDLLSSIKDAGPEAAEEPTELAFSQRSGEYIVLKPPGMVSGLKAPGAMKMLVQHGIKSLIVCGLSTSGCVLRTAVPATDEGFCCQCHW